MFLCSVVFLVVIGLFGFEGFCKSNEILDVKWGKSSAKKRTRELLETFSNREAEPDSMPATKTFTE